MQGLAMNIIFMQTDIKLMLVIVLTSVTVNDLYPISVACPHSGKDGAFTQIT